MRKFFGKQGWNRVLSVVLVMALVAGTVGMNEMFVKAEDVVYPAGVPTVATGGFTSGSDIVEDGVQQGVQLSFAAGGYARARSQWTARQLSDGYRVDVKNFAMTETDAMILVMGPTSSGDYIDDTTGTYGIVYEYDGDFVVMSAAAGSSLMNGGVVSSATTLASQSEIDKLSIYIKSNGTKWDIVVNAYKNDEKIGETYSTSIETTVTKTYFTFGAVRNVTVTDTTNATIGSWTNKNDASYMISYTGIPVQSVSLDRTELSLSKGGTGTLQAAISPSTATDQSVSWSSSNEECVIVDASGNITAKATTTEPVTITATAADGKTATCDVTVSPVIYPVGVPTVATGNFTYQTSATCIDVVENGVQQGVHVTFASGAYQRAYGSWNKRELLDGYRIDLEDFTFADNDSMILVMGPSSQKYITEADTYGVLYEKDGDFAIISANNEGGLMNGYAVQAATTLEPQSAVDRLSLYIKADGSNWNFIVDTYKDDEKVGETYTTSITSTDTSTYFAFGAVGGVTVADAATATIASWTNKSESSYLISYTAPAVKTVELDKEFSALLVGESIDLTATVTPSNASQYVTWSCEDETIAGVNEDGTITGLKAGTTIITATSKTDASITASCVVRVTEPDYITTDDLSSSNSPTLADVEEGVKVTYTAETDAWRRLQTKYDTTDETKNSTVNGYWPKGNGLHFGFKDIQLTNDTDTLAIFMSKRSYSNSYASWYDKAGYMIMYGKDGSFAVVETGASWDDNYIADVHVSEKREELGERLSLDIREEDGVYQFNVNGKTYSVSSKGDDCPVECSDSERVYFSFGLVTGFSVTDAGVMNGPAFKSAIYYGSDGTFTLTDISYITTEELTLANYIQNGTSKISEGKIVLGADDIAVTTALATTAFDGTLDDSCDGLIWEVKAADTGYYIKKVDGDENSYLNISADGVSVGTAQALTIERVSDTTTAYTTISDGMNYLCVSEAGVTVSKTAGKLILYSVTSQLAEVTDEEPLFTLSAFSDLHSERKFTDTEEEYIRDGIVKATQKVREEDNANVIAFLGDLISNKSYDATDAPQGYWLGTGENIEEQWATSRDKMYAAATSATESGRALYLTGNHEYAIGSLDANNSFNSGDYTDGIESKLPELTTENAYFQQSFPDGTSQDIIDAGHVLSYHYNIDGMDIIAINTSYTGTEITSGWSYDLGALDWMEQELAEIGVDKTVLILGHYPTSSLNNDEGGMESYEKIKGIFAKYPNVIYLYGHNHNPYIHTDTYQRVQTFKEDGVTEFQNRYETPTGYTEVFAGSLAYAKDVGLDSTEITGTATVVQGLIVKVYSDRIVFQMKNYSDEENPLGVDTLREYTIMRDVKLNVTENPQAAEVEEYTTAFANFRAGKEKEAPVAPKGYVFAGWYYDEACTEPVASGTTTVAEDKKIFASFLPESVLSVQAQSRYSTTDNETIDTSKIDLRLVTMVDDLKYKEVGFLVTNRSGTVKRYSEHYAFFDLTAAGYSFKPGDFNDCCTRFITINMVNIPISGADFTADREIPVQAYWITQDGTTVYGPARTIKVSTAVANVGNAN